MNSLPQFFARRVAYNSKVLLQHFRKSRPLDRTRFDLSFAYFTPSKVMAAIVKIPTLVHLVLPPKKIDIHVSIRLKNEHKNFEEASFE